MNYDTNWWTNDLQNKHLVPVGGEKSRGDEDQFAIRIYLPLVQFSIPLTPRKSLLSGHDKVK